MARGALAAQQLSPRAADDTSQLSNDFIIVASICTFLTFVTVILRFWTRIKVVRSVGWDDWVTLMSVLTFYVQTASQIVIRVQTDGKTAFPLDALLMTVNMIIVSEVFYLATITLLKIALGIFFLRILIKPWQRTTIYCVMAISTIFGVAMICFASFLCGYVPNPETYLTRKLAGKCVSDESQLGMMYTHGVISAVTDWIYALLPMLMLRDSQLRRREKITVAFIILLGVIGSVASLVRFAYIHDLTASFIDYFPSVVMIGIWSNIEPGLGITASCLATLRPLFRRWLEPLRSYTHDRAAASNTRVYYGKGGASSSSKHVKNGKAGSRSRSCSRPGFSRTASSGILTGIKKTTGTSSFKSTGNSSWLHLDSRPNISSPFQSTRNSFLMPRPPGMSRSRSPSIELGPFLTENPSRPATAVTRDAEEKEWSGGATDEDTYDRYGAKVVLGGRTSSKGWGVGDRDLRFYDPGVNMSYEEGKADEPEFSVYSKSWEDDRPGKTGAGHSVKDITK
ncbi:hypothetical protein K402DRAFT_369989 [Aulographum hederae CBS 113979]|uniref:Rhodopsin domain-containing protein n=1 Tax=Aulographum hederae CBS 113979 TaxID=1176131 RepID=A0A6G1HAF6_9PEZI|nr:hypothetical protein K402DRAFT_369989 [Aulographum hederae CBS 113979]